MPLRESRPSLPADPGERWAAARDFVQRCQDWSEAEMERRVVDGRDLTKWKVYAEFTQHTLRELDDGTLDAWFVSEAVS